MLVSRGLAHAFILAILRLLLRLRRQVKVEERQAEGGGRYIKVKEMHMKVGGIYVKDGVRCVKVAERNVKVGLGERHVKVEESHVKFGEKYTSSLKRGVSRWTATSKLKSGTSWLDNHVKVEERYVKVGQPCQGWRKTSRLDKCITVVSISKLG